MRLRLITEKCDHGFFGYETIANSMWDEKLKEAKEESGVSFSTENDQELVQRTIKIDQNTWDHVDCRFKCELRSASGDWEYPIRYFRCQISDGYAYKLTKSGDPSFCFIPGKDGGNCTLVKTKSGKWSAPDNDEHDDGDEPDERKCWESLKKYLRELVEKAEKEVKSV